jgi:N6-adenosine-specific RNA methylase IME4
MDIIKWPKAKFEKNSLVIDDTVSIDEWKNLGQSLKQVEGCVQFWIGDWARFGDKKGFTGRYTDSKVYDELEQITGLEHSTIKKYKHIAEQTSLLRSNDIPKNVGFSHFQEVAKLTPERQESFLKQASEEKLSVRDLRETIRKADVQFIENVELPDDKFQIIYADPPWKYGNSMPDYFTEQANHYPLMTIQELCDMPIKDITDKNAVLFMWVTSPILEECFQVINAWGFKYKTSFVWDKVKHNMGHYSSVRHEMLLLCIRGSYPKESSNLRDSVFTEERTQHSKKPDYFYGLIEELYPTGKKIELFSRNKREGWNSYGNQL